MTILWKAIIGSLVWRKEVQIEMRLLRADEIECRPGNVTEKGCSLLLYKDSRTDMDLLDEEYGVLGWKREHVKVGENLFCIVSVYDKEKAEWIPKMDVGVPSYSESVKGQSSDSFKRACFNIGVGRELYSSPFIWLSADKVKIEKKNNKLVVKDRFSVSRIQYDEEKRIITGLEIINERNEVVFSHNLSSKCRQETERKTVQVRPLDVQKRRALLKEILRTGVAEEDICKRYNLSDMNHMDDSTFERVMQALRKTADEAA